jgi:hypothetical protein
VAHLPKAVRIHFVDPVVSGVVNGLKEPLLDVHVGHDEEHFDCAVGVMAAVAPNNVSLPEDSWFAWRY